MLGRLAAAVSELQPRRVVANASRCPDLVAAEIERASGTRCEILFEARPLGVCRTIAGLAGRTRGTWMIANTDMVIEADIGAMLEHHRSTGSAWTVLAGPPLEGYGLLHAGRDGSFGGGPLPMHYWGLSIMDAPVFDLAARVSPSTLFGGLAAAARGEGLILSVWGPGESWCDTGEPGVYRENLLKLGSFVHPDARIEEGAALEGSWYVGPCCEVTAGSVLADSVMLEGSRLAGAGSVREVLPWFTEVCGCARG